MKWKIFIDFSKSISSPSTYFPSNVIHLRQWFFQFKEGNSPFQDSFKYFFFLIRLLLPKTSPNAIWHDIFTISNRQNSHSLKSDECDNNHCFVDVNVTILPKKVECFWNPQINNCNTSLYPLSLNAKYFLIAFVYIMNIIYP